MKRIEKSPSKILPKSVRSVNTTNIGPSPRVTVQSHFKNEKNPPDSAKYFQKHDNLPTVLQPGDSPSTSIVNILPSKKPIAKSKQAIPLPIPKTGKTPSNDVIAKPKRSVSKKSVNKAPPNPLLPDKTKQVARKGFPCANRTNKSHSLLQVSVHNNNQPDQVKTIKRHEQLPSTCLSDFQTVQKIDLNAVHEIYLELSKFRKEMVGPKLKLNMTDYDSNESTISSDFDKNIATENATSEPPSSLLSSRTNVSTKCATISTLRHDADSRKRCNSYSLDKYMLYSNTSGIQVKHTLDNESSASLCHAESLLKTANSELENLEVDLEEYITEGISTCRSNFDANRKNVELVDVANKVDTFFKTTYLPQSEGHLLKTKTKVVAMMPTARAPPPPPVVSNGCISLHYMNSPAKHVPMAGRTRNANVKPKASRLPRAKTPISNRSPSSARSTKAKNLQPPTIVELHADVKPSGVEKRTTTSHFRRKDTPSVKLGQKSECAPPPCSEKRTVTSRLRKQDIPSVNIRSGLCIQNIPPLNMPPSQPLKNTDRGNIAVVNLKSADLKADQKSVSPPCNGRSVDQSSTQTSPRLPIPAALEPFINIDQAHGDIVDSRKILAAPQVHATFRCNVNNNPTKPSDEDPQQPSGSTENAQLAQLERQSIECQQQLKELTEFVRQLTEENTSSQCVCTEQKRLLEEQSQNTVQMTEMLENLMRLLSQKLRSDPVQRTDKVTPVATSSAQTVMTTSLIRMDISPTVQIDEIEMNLMDFGTAEYNPVTPVANEFVSNVTAKDPERDKNKISIISSIGTSGNATMDPGVPYLDECNIPMSEMTVTDTEYSPSVSLSTIEPLYQDQFTKNVTDGAKYSLSSNSAEDLVQSVSGSVRKRQSIDMVSMNNQRSSQYQSQKSIESNNGGKRVQGTPSGTPKTEEETPQYTEPHSDTNPSTETGISSTIVMSPEVVNSYRLSIKDEFTEGEVVQVTVDAQQPATNVQLQLGSSPASATEHSQSSPTRRTCLSKTRFGVAKSRRRVSISDTPNSSSENEVAGELRNTVPSVDRESLTRRGSLIPAPMISDLTVIPVHCASSVSHLERFADLAEDADNISQHTHTLYNSYASVSENNKSSPALPTTRSGQISIPPPLKVNENIHVIAVSTPRDAAYMEPSLGEEERSYSGCTESVNSSSDSGAVCSEIVGKPQLIAEQQDVAADAAFIPPTEVIAEDDDTISMQTFDSNFVLPMKTPDIFESLHNKSISRPNSSVASDFYNSRCKGSELSTVNSIAHSVRKQCQEIQTSLSHGWMTAETQTSPQISNEYRALAGQFVLDSPEQGQVKVTLPSPIAETSDKGVMVIIQTPETDTPLTISNGRKVHYDWEDSVDWPLSSSLSEGEVQIPCKCTCSLGELHDCQRFSAKKVVRTSRPSPRKILQYELNDPGLSIKRKVMHNRNWMAYYVVRTSSGESTDSMGDESSPYTTTNST